MWVRRAGEEAARTGKTGKRDGKITSYLLASITRRRADLARWLRDLSKTALA